ncbi:MAG: nitroreductase family protein [Desulfobacteraceae bacterium]|nr:nitroreductase family protein [Desulfobacteraceae bacterium]
MSNEVFDAIYQRRTVRNFEDKPVSDDVLKSVLEAVKWAPSWANTQCWEVVAVTDPQIKARLQQEAVPKSNPAHKAVGSAPVVLALCARLNEAGYYKGQVTTKFGDWFMFDLGIAAQNLSLAAHSLGLGSVIMGLFDQDKAAEVLKVPQNYELVSLIPMGYPSKVPSAPKRKSVEEFCRQNTF